jgi:hypothetical protein
MKKLRLVSLWLTIPAAYACSGGDDTIAVDGGNDVTLDTSNDHVVVDTGTDVGSDVTPEDAGSDATDAAGDSPIDAPPDSPVDAPSDAPTDAAVEASLTCITPSDCLSGFCCGTVVVDGGLLPTCNVESYGSTCSATCSSDIALSCTAVDTIRACAAMNDCLDAGSGYTQCCTVPLGDASPSFCWTSSFATLAGGSCL